MSGGWTLLVLLASAPALAATHVVRIEGMKFQPETLSIRKGDEVVWENHDLVPHTVTGASKDPASLESGTILAGKRYRRRFRRPGEFPYVCRFHPTMKGSLSVAP
jgi:plastocyanin